MFCCSDSSVDIENFRSRVNVLIGFVFCMILWSKVVRKSDESQLAVSVSHKVKGPAFRGKTRSTPD